jgi:neutral trehalase
MDEANSPNRFLGTAGKLLQRTLVAVVRNESLRAAPHSAHDVTPDWRTVATELHSIRLYQVKYH